MRFLMLALSVSLLAAPAKADGYDDARTCIEIVNQRGDMSAAIDHCTRALASRQLRGNNLVPVYYNRAWAYDELGEVDKAIEDYTRVIQIQPDFLDTYVARGYSYAKKGDLESAIEDYSLALRVDPDLFEARFNRALAYEQKGDLDSAVEDYQRAYDVNPENPRVQAVMKRLLLLE